MSNAEVWPIYKNKYTLGDVATSSNQLSQHLDILICVVPKINPDGPTVGPALLKAHLLAAGFSCEIMDLNVKLYNHLQKFNLHNKFYFEDDGLFTTDKSELKESFHIFFKEHEAFFMSWIKLIAEKNPKYLGLSLLTTYSQAMAVKLSELVREHLPAIKIVWGGAQIDEDTEIFAQRNLLDHFISGDGEFSIVELLKGNLTAPGIDSRLPNQVEDLNRVLVPNYDDINWQEYALQDFPNTVYITGSRGCVRKCSFCNVAQIWPKFRHRSAKHIIHEIESLKDKYNRQTFKFTDSLINGSIRAYRELLHELIEYKKKNPSFFWISQWIVRPKEYSPEEDFRMLKESGCLWLEIGIESFSQETRYHMGKKFTNADIDWCLGMLQKYKIASSVLMIVGYPIETEEHHQQTLRKIQEFFEMGYMTNRDEFQHGLLNLCFTSTLMINENVPLWDMVKDGITNYRSKLEWEYNENTLEKRIRWFNEVNELIAKLQTNSELHWQIRRTLREQNEANLKSSITNRIL